LERYRIRDPALDPLDHEARLVDLVVGRVQVDRLAVLAFGPQALAEAIGVVGDHRVGGLQDVGGGTVVLFEADRARAGEVAQEVLHVLDPRPAPAVDRLVVVADHEDSAALAREQAHERVLDRVGVLELVHQQMPEALAVVREQAGMVAQQLVRAQQQLGEVDQAGAPADRVIGGVDAQHRVGEGLAALDVLRALAFVLAAIDEPRRLARRMARLVQAELADHALHQALLVVRVEHLEGLGQARVLPVQAQQPVREPVEGADP
jgi:hypothetical protein